VKGWPLLQHTFLFVTKTETVQKMYAYSKRPFALIIMRYQINVDLY